MIFLYLFVVFIAVAVFGIWQINKVGNYENAYGIMAYGGLIFAGMTVVAGVIKIIWNITLYLF